MRPGKSPPAWQPHPEAKAWSKGFVEQESLVPFLLDLPSRASCPAPLGQPTRSLTQTALCPLPLPYMTSVPLGAVCAYSLTAPT